MIAVMYQTYATFSVVRNGEETTLKEPLIRSISVTGMLQPRERPM